MLKLAKIIYEAEKMRDFGDVDITYGSLRRVVEMPLLEYMARESPRTGSQRKYRDREVQFSRATLVMRRPH